MTGAGDPYIRAKVLIDQAYMSEDPEATDALLRQAHALLSRSIEEAVPEALYLHACSTLFLEGLDEATQDARYATLIQQAAKAGDARAQFRLGQMYEPGSDLEADAEKSAYWFEQSAMQGYAYAQWVHGLNLLTGHGCARNEGLGLDFIRRAAEGRFEGAIEFVADAYAAGTHGCPSDSEQAAKWRHRLTEPDLMRY